MNAWLVLVFNYCGLSPPIFSELRMPTKWKPMRQIKEVLRLKFEAKLRHERIAAATGLSKVLLPLPADFLDNSASSTLENPHFQKVTSYQCA